MNPKLPQIQAKIREVCPEMRCYDPENPKNCTYHDDHELGLVHVLRAIEACNVEVELHLYDDILNIGHYALQDRTGEYQHAFWNLTKPLHEQEESVISFLHELLCP